MRKTLKRTGKLVSKAARKVANASGGKDLVEYTGTKVAKAFAPKSQKKYITSNATGKQAAKSAAKVAGTIGGIVAGGIAGTALKARRAAKAKAAVGRTRELKTSAQSKRFNRWEAEERARAKKRIEKRKKK